MEEIKLTIAKNGYGSHLLLLLQCRMDVLVSGNVCQNIIIHTKWEYLSGDNWNKKQNLV